MSDDISPKAYHTVTPYLIVPDVPRLLQFLVEAFGASERVRLRRRTVPSCMPRSQSAIPS